MKIEIQRILRYIIQVTMILYYKVNLYAKIKSKSDIIPMLKVPRQIVLSLNNDSFVNFCICKVVV